MTFVEFCFTFLMFCYIFDYASEVVTRFIAFLNWVSSWTFPVARSYEGFYLLFYVWMIDLTDVLRSKAGSFLISVGF